MPAGGSLPRLRRRLQRHCTAVCKPGCPARLSKRSGGLSKRSGWKCTAFPDDENNQFDALLVGLISIGVAMPVAYVLSTCFEIANDSEAPENWLEWVGIQKLIWGRRAHRGWHYTGPAGQPNRFVRWYCRSSTAPVSETAANLCRSFLAWLT